MAFGWKKYLDDYEETSEGKYEYVGMYYRFFVEDGLLKRIRRAYAFLAAAMVLLFVMAGLNTYLSGLLWYVSVPYAASILPLAFLVMDTVRICRAPERMTRKEYNESVGQHKTARISMLILAGLTAIGDAVFLIFVYPALAEALSLTAEVLTQELIFLGCCVLMTVATAMWMWLAKKLPSGPEGSRK